MQKIIDFILSHLFHILKKVKSSKFFNEIWYRQRNRDFFSDLYEHEKMLADTPRVDAYHKAISKYVKPGDTVIDLGTGSGILAFFASLQSPEKVYAIDHSDIIKSAELIAKHNELENIQFIQKHSKNFTLDSRVDVIIQEQLGDFLFNENVVSNIIDLRERLLKKGGIILPSQFELFIEPVKLKDNRFVPFIWQQKIHGIEFSCLRQNEVTYRGYYRISSRDSSLIDFFMCEPEKIYYCDLQTINEADMPQQLSYSRTIKRGGRLDGFLVYFQGIFDDEISFSTGPTEYRARNWSFWLLRVEAANCEPGQTLNFTLKIDSWSDIDSWYWDYSKNTD